MQIDWFTLGAEIVNFLILLWLLQRFLYRPIVNAMEKREQAIADDLREAEEKRRRAEEEVEKYQLKQRELDDRRDELMQEARRDADERRRKLLDEMRAEAEDSRRSWQLAVQQEKAAFLNELEERVGESAVELARRALADMADTRLETQVVRVVLDRLDKAEAETRQQIAAALHGETVRVDSAFKMADDDRAALEQALRDLSTNQEEAHGADRAGMKLDYRVVKDMVCGVRLTTGEYEVSWEFAGYLAALRTQFNHAIEDALDESVIDEATAESDVGPDTQDGEFQEDDTDAREPEATEQAEEETDEDAASDETAHQPNQQERA